MTSLLETIMIVIHLTDTCFSRILNSINPQTPTTCTVAEFIASESQEHNDQLHTESPVEGGHVEYIDVEATEIRSRRNRDIRKRTNEDMVYY